MTFNVGYTSICVVFGTLIFVPVIYTVVNWCINRVPKGLRLPPGPPARLISGNAKDMPPPNHEWETYDRWAKEYGEIVHVSMYGKHMIYLNTMEAAKELLEKRSSIYSDRFEFTMLLDLMGWNFNLGLMPYGERWRRHRRTFQQKFHANAARTYYPIHINQTKTLLLNCYHTPENFSDHLKYHAGATIVQIIYGVNPSSIDDPYIQASEQAMKGVAEAGDPGTFLVDIFPILKHVPEWVPGAGFKKKARIWREQTVEMAEAPFRDIKKAMKAGTAVPESVTVSLLEELSHKHNPAPDEEEIIKNVAAVGYATGSDSVLSAMTTFILAMVLYPEVQKKAQAELDSVIGMGRLPGFEDREHLPYVSALCKEVHRWHPAGPLGVAHRVMQDDVYGEYFIPKGSVIFENVWSILHDEKVYGPTVNEFEPERFLDGKVDDPVAQFGLGRRICAGRHMAENSLWNSISSMLHVFNISPAKDENGQEIPVKRSFTSGVLSRPMPFKCSIVPRSVHATNLILEGSDT